MAQPLTDGTNTRGNMLDRDEEPGRVCVGDAPHGGNGTEKGQKTHSSGCDRHEGIGMVGLAPQLNSKWQISH